ncbi:hypothetical protein PMKS-004108 [Pichia membranifaciens]|uniref:Altered inheritance of mitochondria protein 9, mitochondrial n=1 Tax=Pichia membranifaciens TaxID=4926 RepID=A0A1Q2YM35_9ASCO|nr:hypothetical protein PMKS-004108 [Pichia membranifaciens]
MPSIQKVRFNSTEGKHTGAGKATSTNLFNDADPNRNHMFEYSWGTWLKNDEIEKQKRLTKFSIQGLNDLIKRIISIEKSGVVNEKNPDEIKKIENIRVLSNNISHFFKDSKSEDNIKQIVSLHEGKHHRIYRIEIEGVEKKLVLRLPYTLHSQLFTKRKLESEVATMDFLTNAFNLNIPKVLSYSGDYDNFVGHPFILMEYVDDVEFSLMKKWNPLMESKDNRLDDPEAIEKLNEVIEPLADFNKIVTDFIFDNYGSIYFKDDCPEDLEKIAYENQDRWVIGPTVETAYYRNRKYVKEEDLNKYVGPWKGSEPLKMIKDLVELELHSLKVRLSLVDSGEVTADTKEGLEFCIKIFKKLDKIAGEMFNLNENETLIPNLNELLKPRLFIGDLDPMNVLVRSGEKGYEFVDFENSVVKPFLISSYPKFLEYNGAKIFNLKDEIENFEGLDEIEQEQYKFMFKRTRNQFLWEVSINKRSKDLVGVISPVIKLIKNCYLNVLNFKQPKDSLYIENGLIEISTMWDNYNENGVVGKFKGEKNPIKFTEDEIKEFTDEIREYEAENSSKPFIATDGWVPQDMFKRLQDQGMIVRDDEKNEWTVDTEKILK